MRFSPVLCAAALASMASLAHADPATVPEGAVAQVQKYERVTLPDGRAAVAYTISTYPWAHKDQGRWVVDKASETLRVVQPAEDHHPYYRGANVAINALPDGQVRLRLVGVSSPNGPGALAPGTYIQGGGMTPEPRINFNLGK